MTSRASRRHRTPEPQTPDLLDDPGLRILWFLRWLYEWGAWLALIAMAGFGLLAKGEILGAMVLLGGVLVAAVWSLLRVHRLIAENRGRSVRRAERRVERLRRRRAASGR